jgi:hypothetical protein
VARLPVTFRDEPGRCRLDQPPVAAGAPATLMLDGDRRPLARGQRTDHAPADPRSEPLVCHGGHLALVSESGRLAAIVERFPIVGTGSADGVPARHRGRRKPGSETGRWRARAGSAV